LLAQLIAARGLGPADFGVVRLAENLIGIGWTVAAAGWASAAIRFGGAARSEAGAAALFRLTARQGLVVAAVVTILAAIAAILFREDAAKPALLVTAGVIVPLSVVRIGLGYLQAVKNLRAVVAWSLRFAVATVGLTGLGLVAGDLIGWSWGRVASSVLVGWWIATRLPWRSGAERPNGEASAGTRYALLVTASLVLDRVATSSDAVFLELLQDDRAIVGQFGVIAATVNAAALAPAAFVAFMLPRLAAIDSRDRFLAAARALARPYFAGIGLLTLILAIAGPLILPRVFGDPYAATMTMVPPMAVVFAMNAVLSFGGTLLISLGRAELTVAQSLIGVIVGVTLNVLLVGSSGAWGLVVGALATAAVRVGCMGWLVVRAIRGMAG
jgi:O-antigen/teichoic acid export membrane protein